MKTFIKFVAILFLILTLINYYSYIAVSIYLQMVFIILIIGCVLLLAYAMLRNLHNSN